ncbi:helix-turn-helix domain-containing protein [Paenibacillus sp. D9]|uniref:helix-turn-helix domain-containing protein n=1 Tax=Paenibacillus sp. D9 TaxID=665792 RepID=UPI000675E3FE|nr:helix-turn-helix transcriptional regulator [Paenibacillus sp. D9]
MSNELGSFLKELREKKDLSISDLAYASGVSGAQISRIETGKREQPRPETLQKLAQGLRISYGQLAEKAGYFDGMQQSDKQEFFAYHEANSNLDLVLSEMFNQVFKLDQETKLVIIKEVGVSGKFGEHDEDIIETINKNEAVNISPDFSDMSLLQKLYLIDILSRFVRYFAVDETYLEKLYEQIKTGKIPDPYESGRELVKSIDLSDDNIKEEFSIIVDGRPLTEKEMQKILAQIRLDRQFE